MDELQQVEKDLTRLRTEARELRETIGDRAGDGPTDPAEISMLIANAEQLESLADQLELRKENLVKESGS